MVSKHWSPGLRLAQAAALGVLALQAGVAAQDAPAKPAGQAAPRAAPAGQGASGGQQKPDESRPTFAVSINLVTTDVIARDNRGQFVADLTKDDFQVLEDGVEQEIASLTLVHGGRIYNQLQPPPPPTPEGILLPPSRPANDAAGRIFLLFVDDLHLDFRNTGRIRQLFKKVADTLIHEGDMFGIVSTGPSSLAIDLTYDRRRLEEAIKRISGSGLRPTEIVTGPTGAEGPSEVRYRAHVAFSTAYDLLRNMEKVQNRRKALIYVSNGYDFDPFREGRMKNDPFYSGDPYDDTNPFYRQTNQFADADLARELAELTRTANRANTTVYTIDPRGLIAGADLDEQVDPVEWQEHVRKTQDSLRVIAEQTGGIAVVNQNDFEKALKRIDAETSDYYMLGYYSSNPDPTKRHRTIEVKVKREGVNVWARKGYSLQRPAEPSAQKR